MNLREELRDIIHNAYGKTVYASPSEVAHRVAEKVGIDSSRLWEIELMVANILQEPKFKKVPFEERYLFLPHCLRRVPGCQGTYGDEGLICAHCTPSCAINQITAYAKELGYKFFVVPGGSMMLNVVARDRPKAAVGVACPPELKEAIAKNKWNTPFQIVPLSKTGCVNTKVDVERVKKTLDLH